jgi:hypothetical protein
VVCLLIFYDRDGAPIETSLVGFDGMIAPGLAKRVTGKVDTSVQKLTAAGTDTVRTKLDYRILYFDLVAGDEPKQ